MNNFPPQRIVCLTEETVELLYLLGEEDKIVGVTGYAVRPKIVRKQKPRISSFKSANTQKIIELKPDIILAFSDIQSEIVANLVKKGQSVLCFNQRDIEGIFNMMQTISSLLDIKQKGINLVSKLKKNIYQIKNKYSNYNKLKVYFEEWNDPLITGLKWVSELINIAGGEDIFYKKSLNELAKDRIISEEEVIKENPDIIIGSWCGKKVNFDQIRNRRGWNQINAIKYDKIYEIKSPLILQPGPAALTDGLDEIVKILNISR